MSVTGGERLAELLSDVDEPPVVGAYRKLFMKDLAVAVDGIGPLRLPVAHEQATLLRELGHHARFGRGEETLIDPEVRDTWEIPKESVHIEWTDSFEAVLELMRDDLGLPAHCRLEPDFHSMLLYETGQFFVTHQGSEKDDAMVATLVVTLPSAHTGGVTAAARAEAASVVEAAMRLARRPGDPVLVMAALRATEARHELAELATICAGRLRASLARPRRASGDWSVEPPDACPCELCGTLDAFLRDPQRRTFEWPLAQANRAHIHSSIDGAELPVRHETRRQGRPYTLVLTKTDATFDRELRARTRAEADLAWLTENWKITG